MQDSLARLETVLGRLTGDSAAAGLFRLGQLKARALSFMDLKGGPGKGYALEHPDEYRGNEVAGNFIYTGVQWHALLRRFPDSPYADDAAWGIANLGRGGECEHSLSCLVDVTLTPYTVFLEGFPSSPYADSAAARASEGLAAVIGLLEPDSLRNWGFDLETPLFVPMLARYDSTVSRLPTPWRADALRLTQALRKRVAELEGRKVR